MNFYILKKETLYKEYNKKIELKEIIQKRKINTFFQPIVSLNEGYTIGFESLNRPVNSIQFPTTDSFYEYVGKSKDIFLAEGLIRNHSLENFSEQVRLHQNHKDQLIFLNILPQVLMDPKFRNGLTVEVLQKYQISPYQIVLELTEKEATTNIAHFDQLIDHYRLQGFRIAVDDAGTGYNSLKTLVSVKPEFIKLDKSLIRNIEKHPEQQNLVELLLEFAGQTDTIVIAEGIESVSELDFLQKLGVHYGQGYVLGKPKNTLCNGKLPLQNEYYKRKLG